MKTRIEIDRILSYQKLVYKNGIKTFKKKIYLEYMDELFKNGLEKLRNDEIANSENLVVKITFYHHDKRIGDIDNITKPILDTLEHHIIIKNDKYVNKLVLDKIYSKGTKDVIEIEIKTLD